MNAKERHVIGCGVADMRQRLAWPVAMAALQDFIIVVRCLRSHPQVEGIATSRIVTSVTDAEVIGDGAVKEAVGQSVRLDSAPVEFDPSVSFCRAARPRPACRRVATNINVAPELSLLGIHAASLTAMRERSVVAVRVSTARWPFSQRETVA